MTLSVHIHAHNIHIHICVCVCLSVSVVSLSLPLFLCRCVETANTGWCIFLFLRGHPHFHQRASDRTNFGSNRPFPVSQSYRSHRMFDCILLQHTDVYAIQRDYVKCWRERGREREKFVCLYVWTLCRWSRSFWRVLFVRTTTSLLMLLAKISVATKRRDGGSWLIRTSIKK